MPHFSKVGLKMGNCFPSVFRPVMNENGLSTYKLFMQTKLPRFGKPLSDNSFGVLSDNQSDL